VEIGYAAGVFLRQRSRGSPEPTAVVLLGAAGGDVVAPPTRPPRTLPRCASVKAPGNALLAGEFRWKCSTRPRFLALGLFLSMG